ncbi:CapA family protein [Fodinicurvata halophila]|uniref:CapA family protein n=1 Tax=Fodinicurvata halophila TaxID=1419723 RepID=A0ABV8UHS6_9PROT
MDAPLKLFLCGDVMTGRGVDQILPHPTDPTLHEDFVRSAHGYVDLAEQRSGPIPRPAPFDYIWGDALAALTDRAPALRIANLETALTARGHPEPKGINYRMHPENATCLSAAGLDCCVLANNHVLDWGAQGLGDTLATLKGLGIACCGAGANEGAAAAPAILSAGQDRRILVFSYACPSSGVPRHWAAGPERAGVNLLASLQRAQVDRVASWIARWRQPGDSVVLSLHWGPNWGHDIPAAHREFACELIERGAADLVHGHSSHHPLGLECHEGKLILYGCGDFINDYEGIGGHTDYRPELVLGYLAELDPTHRRLETLEMLPFRTRRFRLQHATGEEASWLAGTLNRNLPVQDQRVLLSEENSLRLSF